MPWPQRPADGSSGAVTVGRALLQGPQSRIALRDSAFRPLQALTGGRWAWGRGLWAAALNPAPSAPCGRPVHSHATPRSVCLWRESSTSPASGSREQLFPSGCPVPGLRSRVVPCSSPPPLRACPAVVAHPRGPERPSLHQGVPPPPLTAPQEGCAGEAPWRGAQLALRRSSPGSAQSASVSCCRLVLSPCPIWSFLCLESQWPSRHGAHGPEPLTELGILLLPTVDRQPAGSR